MLKEKGSPVQVVLYEGAGSTELSEEARLEVMSALLDKGYAVARSGQGARSSPAEDEPLLVLGDFGGEAPALEDERGRVPIEARDIRGLGGEAVLGLVEEFSLFWEYLYQ